MHAHTETSPVSCARYTTSHAQTQMDHTHFRRCRCVRDILLAVCISLVLRCAFKPANIFHLGELSQLPDAHKSEVAKEQTRNGLEETRTQTSCKSLNIVGSGANESHFNSHCSQGIMKEAGVHSAKFKWVTQICECVSRESL